MRVFGYVGNENAVPIILDGLKGWNIGDMTLPVLLL